MTNVHVIRGTGLKQSSCDWCPYQDANGAPQKKSIQFYRYINPSGPLRIKNQFENSIKRQNYNFVCLNFRGSL
jgi:hypothetical protein